MKCKWWQGDSSYCHQLEVVKRTVYGHQGYRVKIVWEDDYEMAISDMYRAEYNGIVFDFNVTYKTDRSSAFNF